MSDVNQWLRQLKGFEQAAILQQLAKSPVSTSMLVRGDIVTAVLRVDGPAALRLGLDRRVEWTVLQQAWQAGLGPRPLAFAPGQGWLLTQYLDRPVWPETRVHQPEGLQSLAMLLRKVHSLPGSTARFCPRQSAERYARGLPRAQAAPLLERISALSEQLYEESLPRCLCHHDPHPGNVLGIDAPVLIDWEYAAAGRPLFDLAAVIGYCQLSSRQGEYLLAAWNGSASPELSEQLHLFCQLYEALAGLWRLAIAQP